MKTGLDKDADSMGMLSLQNEGQIPLTPPLEKGVDDPINNFAHVGRTAICAPTAAILSAGALAITAYQFVDCHTRFDCENKLKWE